MNESAYDDVSESSSLSFRDDNDDYLNQIRRVEAARNPERFAQSPPQSSSDDTAELENQVVGNDAFSVEDTEDGDDFEEDFKFGPYDNTAPVEGRRGKKNDPPMIRRADDEFHAPNKKEGGWTRLWNGLKGLGGILKNASGYNLIRHGLFGANFRRGKVSSSERKIKALKKKLEMKNPNTIERGGNIDRKDYLEKSDGQREDIDYKEYRNRERKLIKNQFKLAEHRRYYTGFKTRNEFRTAFTGHDKEAQVQKLDIEDDTEVVTELMEEKPGEKQRRQWGESKWKEELELWEAKRAPRQRRKAWFNGNRARENPDVTDPMSPKIEGKWLPFSNMLDMNEENETKSNQKANQKANRETVRGQVQLEPKGGNNKRDWGKKGAGPVNLGKISEEDEYNIEYDDEKSEESLPKVFR